MYTRITGKHDKKPTIIVEIYENGNCLLYLEGTKPFIRRGLSIERAKEIILEANYTITIEEIF